MLDEEIWIFKNLFTFWNERYNSWKFIYGIHLLEKITDENKSRVIGVLHFQVETVNPIELQTLEE